MDDRYLVASDLQAPFQAKHAIRFLKDVQKEFKIPKENVACVGDEVDALHLSRFPKSPDMRMSAVQEYEETLAFFQEMYRAFPIMRLCYSNHGARLHKKAIDAQLPTLYLKSYAELLQAPKSWQWARRWHFKTKHQWVMEHGHKFSGINGHRQAAESNGVSTVIGHIHAHAAISYINTEFRGTIWGANCGSLIDPSAVAFEYGKDSKYQPVLSVLVVVDNGRRPILVQYDDA